MKYITVNEDVFVADFEDKECSLTIRSGQKGEVEISTDSQEVAQIGMALLIGSVEVGVDDVDSFSEMIDGMGEDATAKMAKFLREVLDAIE